MAAIINLVSDQIAPIILGALHYRPSHLVFIRSGLEKYANNVARICRYLNQRLTVTHEEHIVDPYHFEDVLSKLRALPLDSESLCNITGGTKVMALAAFQAMNERGVPSFYIDTDNGRLITFRQSRVEAEPFDSRLTSERFRLDHRCHDREGTDAVVSKRSASRRIDQRHPQPSERVAADQPLFPCRPEPIHPRPIFPGIPRSFGTS